MSGESVLAKKEVECEYLVLSGQVGATKTFVHSLLRAGWLVRLIYNATIDAHVPFEVGVEYRLTESKARREGLDLPNPPTPSATFLPIPKPQELSKVLTRLREKHSVFSDIPFVMLRRAINDGCEARSRHVANCVKAKAEGKSLPKLRFRSALNDMDVSSEAFRLYRCGLGEVSPRLVIGPGSDKTRKRRQKKKEKREAAWAETKRKAGWDEGRIERGLAKRKNRQDRARQSQSERDANLPDKPKKSPRRDSPDAFIGMDRVKLDVKGFPRVRVRLSRPIPKDAEVVRIHFVKAHGPEARVEARLILSVSKAERPFDEIKVGETLHALMKTLPASASPYEAVLAARAAGLSVRGDDTGIGKPSCDDLGVSTPKLKVDREAIRAMKGLQVDLARKDAFRETAVGKDGKRRYKTKRSERVRQVRVRMQAISRKAKNRSKTRAHQDAARLVAGRMLVATDPPRMVQPLLTKGGPAERRTRREVNLPALPNPVIGKRPDGSAIEMKARQARAMRANLHAVRPALRIRRVSVLCERVGAVHATPGHEGTTRSCPQCLTVVPKSLGERTHACGCGLNLPRDQASALMTLGKALLEYREGPDPGGRIATRREALAKAEKKRQDKKDSIAKGREKAKKLKEAATASSNNQGVVTLGSQAEASGQCSGAEHHESIRKDFPNEALPSSVCGGSDIHNFLLLV